MSFVKAVNPFQTILCVPYYYLWILIILSWIFAIIEMVYVYYTYKWRRNILKQLDIIENRISEQIRDQFELELSKIVIDGDILSNAIISIIMAMLPEKYQHKDYNTLCNIAKKNIHRKSVIIACLQLIYPTVRFIANFMNFIIVLMHYTNWYNDNKNLSNWRKYCALIIVLLYMPNCKGRAPMRYLVAQWFEDCDDEWLMYIFFVIAVTIDFAFAALFFVVSFPIIFTGFFIYLPTLFIIAVSACILAVGTYKLIFVIYDQGVRVNVFVIPITFCGIWYFSTILMSTMEFFHTDDWAKGWKIGFLGQYCDQNDYFTLEKWNNYSWDIKFLIVSWIAF